jgi:hypothetical protein
VIVLDDPQKAGSGWGQFNGRTADSGKAEPCCGGRMIVIETLEQDRAPRASSLGEIRIDTS